MYPGMDLVHSGDVQTELGCSMVLYGGSVESLSKDVSEFDWSLL